MDELQNPIDSLPGYNPADVAGDTTPVDNYESTFMVYYQQWLAIRQDYLNRSSADSVWTGLAHAVGWGDAVLSTYESQADDIQLQFASAITPQAKLTGINDMQALVQSANNTFFGKSSKTTVVDETGQTHTQTVSGSTGVNAAGISNEIDSTTKLEVNTFLKPITDVLSAAKWPTIIVGGIVLLVGAAYVARSVK